MNIFKIFKSKDLKITPDFKPMIRIIFWNSLGFFFFQFLIPYVTAQLLKATGVEMGLTFSFQILGGLISAPLVGYLTDKVSKKKLVLIGSFGRGACYVIMYIGILASSLIIFALGLFVLGFFVGFFWSPIDALISEKSHKSHRSSAFGKRGGMIGRGNLVGSIISFLIFGLASIYTPNNYFLIYSPLLLFTASNVLGGIIFYRKVDERLSYELYVLNTDSLPIEYYRDFQSENSNQDISSKPKLTLVLLLGFLILMLAFMTTNVNQTLAQPFFQRFLIDDLKVINPIIVMIIYFPSQVISLLLAPRLGKIADSINPMVGISIISGFGALVTWLIINSTSGWMFGIILMFDSTFAWAGNLILQNVLSRISKSHRGKIFGASNWISFVGAIIGPIIGGFVWDNLGHISPFIISIFIELSVIPLYISAIKILKPFMKEKID